MLCKVLITDSIYTIENLTTVHRFLALVEFVMAHESWLLTGLSEDGVLRINGNARTIENMRYSFDYGRDGEFDLNDDVLSVAGLLKLFLREIPEGLIPAEQTKEFITVQDSKHNFKQLHIYRTVAGKSKA